MMNFDEIRPYNNSELAEAIDRILAYPEFDSIISYTFPSSSGNPGREVDILDNPNKL